MSDAEAASKLRVADAYGKLPLGFEANRGQTAADVQFVSRGAGYTLFLTSTEAVLALRKAPRATNDSAPRLSGKNGGGSASILRMKLVDSNPDPQVSQRDELPGESQYIIGNDPRNWHTHVPRYGKVEYGDVYPGVNLIYYGNQRQLEYDFLIAPGANPDAIELAFEGTEAIHLDAGGDLLLDTGDGDVRLKAPLIYQETGGRRVPIPGGYEKRGADRVAFHVGQYDSTRPLVVDPILVYSSYLGGGNQDFAFAVAVDPAQSIYVAGLTNSLDFPTPTAPPSACAPTFGNGYPGCPDIFVTTIQGGIQHSSYIGGTFEDVATGIAVSPSGIHVTGWTRSPDFPTINAVAPAFGGDPSTNVRAFVLKLDGSGLAYSTYLGGDEPSVIANGIAVDSQGAAYVTGSSGSLGLPPDAFVTKLTPDGSALAYSVRLGGWNYDAGYAIAVDAQGYASITGETLSPDFPRVNTFGPPGGEGFVAKLVPDGSGFVYSTYLYGGGVGTGIATAGPNTYVTGWVHDAFYGSARPFGGGATDAFVTVLDFVGRPGYYTYLGGSGDDRASAIAVEATGSVWVSGVTTSADFPLVNPLQGRVRDRDVFVVKFGSGFGLAFSTYLGGSGREQLETNLVTRPGPPAPIGPALAVDYSISAAYIAGFTDSTDFPTAGLIPGLPITNGPINGFVAWIADDGIPTKPDLMVANSGGTPAEAEVGAVIGYRFDVTNKGPAPAANATLTDRLPAGAVIYNGPGAVVVWPPSALRSCAHDDTLVFCSLGRMSEGDAVTVAILVTTTTPGTLINTATVASDVVDGDVRDNVVTTTTVVTQGSADLSVTGSAASDLVMLDGIITYTLDVENHGPTTSASTMLTDTLPAGATLISATQTGSSGSCAGTTVITCQWPALSLSSVARVTIVVRATSPGTLTNSAVVSGAAPDPNNANNAVTSVTSVNRPPTANAGPDQIVSAGADCQAIVALNGTGSGDLDGDALTYTWTIDNLLPPPIVLSPPSGTLTGPTPTGPLPLGTHTITLTVNDGRGGTASDTIVVTVRDVTAPSFGGVPAPMIIEQSTQSGATFTVPMPTGADNCSSSVVVSSNAPAIFPPGPTIVTFTARDAAGNSATATTLVTVVDTRAPTFAGVPPPMTVEQTGPSGTSVALPMPTASDSVSGSVVVSSNAPAVFPPGPTIVTFTARDAAGNSATATTTVTVVDTVSPTLAIVSPQARDYVHSDGLTTSFSAADAASGLAAGMPTAALDGRAVANGRSISLLTLALGTHSFAVSATDVAGNSRSQTVTFGVIATVDSLIASVNVFAGQKKIDDPAVVKRLLAVLNDAKQAVQRGNKAAAIIKLQDFIVQVNAQSGRHITPDAAQILVADAQYVMRTLR